MPNPTKYDPTKKYLVSGSTLNSLQEQIDTNKVIEFTGYKVNRNPGVGTRLKIDLTGGASLPWDLEREAGTFTLSGIGEIYTDPARADSQLDIEGIDGALDFGSGKIVCFDLTWDEDGDEVMQLFSGTEPAFYPNLYQYDEEETGQVIRAIYPLWRGISGTMPTGASGQQYDGWWAKRFPRSASLLLQWAGHELDADFQHLPIPILFGL